MTIADDIFIWKGNVSELASWLGGRLYRTSFRPVPLLEFVKTGNELVTVNSSNPGDNIGPSNMISRLMSILKWNIIVTYQTSPSSRYGKGSRSHYIHHRICTPQRYAGAAILPHKGNLLILVSYYHYDIYNYH